MKRLTFFLIFILFSLSLAAQWSDSPAAPTAIAAGAGAQSLPKVAVCANGNTYISYFDNASGAYKVYLKLYNAEGIALWAEPLEMAGSVSDSWLTDYDLTTDNAGRAFVTFQDIRSGNNEIYVYKVSPAGHQLWGETGICVSQNIPSADANYSPKVICTNDYCTYIAWENMGTYSSIYIQKLNDNGSLAWDEPYLIGYYGASATWPQMIKSLDNGILLKFYEDSGPFWAPTRNINVAHLSSSGTMLWLEAITSDAGITAWTQIIGFEPDTMGGAFLAWHDDRDQNNVSQAFYAHIDSTGNLSTPLGGVAISNHTQYQHFYPRLSYNPATEELFIAIRITDLDQNNAGVILQIFDLQSNPLFGAGGRIHEQISQYDFEPQFAWNFLDKYYMFQSNTNLSQPNSQGIMCTHNSEAGYYGSWSSAHLATTDSAKMHYDFASHSQGWVICVWEDGLSDFDIYAAKYWFNGNIGGYKGIPENVQATFIPPNSIKITWEAPLYYPTPDFYYVQAGNHEVTQPDTAREYTFTNLPAGLYPTYVRAVYSGLFMSAEGEIIEIPVANLDESAPALSCAIGPNPFVDHLSIRLKNYAPKPVKIGVYNLKGQKVCEIFSGMAPKSDPEFIWDGKDGRGQALGTGIYFLNVKTAGFSQTYKVFKMK